MRTAAFSSPQQQCAFKAQSSLSIVARHQMARVSSSSFCGHQQELIWNHTIKCPLQHMAPHKHLVLDSVCVQVVAPRSVARGVRAMAVKAEISYVMVKPDGVQRGLVGDIISR
jgi:hypothetical protein